MNKIEKAILTELNEWDLSCSEEPTLKIELAKALGRVVKNCSIPDNVGRSEQLKAEYKKGYDDAMDSRDKYEYRASYDD